MDITTNPALVTSVDGNDTTLVIKCNLPKNGTGERTAFITVVSGTFQFNVGATADNAACPAYIDDDKVEPIAFQVASSGATDLHFHAGAGSQTFRIGIA